MEPVHGHFLETAESLLADGSRLGAGAFRRAASTAYYALFHRLALLAASAVGRPRTDSGEFEKLYRFLDHGPTRRALKASPEFAAGLGVPFERLQDARILADYSAPWRTKTELTGAKGRIAPDKIRELVELAKEAIAYVDSLDRETRRRLAVLLLVENKRK